MAVSTDTRTQRGHGNSFRDECRIEYRDNLNYQSGLSGLINAAIDEI
jgi:hypothetical protein